MTFSLSGGFNQSTQLSLELC